MHRLRPGSISQLGSIPEFGKVVHSCGSGCFLHRGGPSCEWSFFRPSSSCGHRRIIAGLRGGGYSSPSGSPCFRRVAQTSDSPVAVGVGESLAAHPMLATIHSRPTLTADGQPGSYRLPTKSWKEIISRLTCVVLFLRGSRPGSRIVLVARPSRAAREHQRCHLQFTSHRGATGSASSSNSGLVTQIAEVFAADISNLQKHHGPDSLQSGPAGLSGYRSNNLPDSTSPHEAGYRRRRPPSFAGFPSSGLAWPYGWFN